MIEILAIAVGLLAGAGGTVAYSKVRQSGAKRKNEQTVASAEKKANDIVLKAQNKAMDIGEAAKKE